MEIKATDTISESKRASPSDPIAVAPDVNLKVHQPDAGVSSSSSTSHAPRFWLGELMVHRRVLMQSEYFQNGVESWGNSREVDESTREKRLKEAEEKKLKEAEKKKRDLVAGAAVPGASAPILVPASAPAPALATAPAPALPPAPAEAKMSASSLRAAKDFIYFLYTGTIFNLRDVDLAEFFRMCVLHSNPRHTLAGRGSDCISVAADGVELEYLRFVKTVEQLAQLLIVIDGAKVEPQIKSIIRKLQLNIAVMAIFATPKYRRPEFATLPQYLAERGRQDLATPLREEFSNPTGEAANLGAGLVILAKRAAEEERRKAADEAAKKRRREEEAAKKLQREQEEAAEKLRREQEEAAEKLRREQEELKTKAQNEVLDQIIIRALQEIAKGGAGHASFSIDPPSGYEMDSLESALIDRLNNKGPAHLTLTIDYRSCARAAATRETRSKQHWRKPMCKQMDTSGKGCCSSGFASTVTCMTYVLQLLTWNWCNQCGKGECCNPQAWCPETTFSPINQCCFSTLNCGKVEITAFIDEKKAASLTAKAEAATTAGSRK